MSAKTKKLKKSPAPELHVHAALTPELIHRIERLQRFANLGSQNIFAIRKTSAGKPVELELVALTSPLNKPPIEAAKSELREIARLLFAPPEPLPAPRYPSPRPDWRDVVSKEPGLVELMESSPIKTLNAEAFADACFDRNALLKVKGDIVKILTRDRLRGTLRDYQMISPCVYADRNDKVAEKPYLVLSGLGDLNAQARRIAFIAKSFPLAAVVFDGKNQLGAWYRAANEEREKLLQQWAILAGDTQAHSWARMPDFRRKDQPASIAFRVLAAAGLNDWIDQSREKVREGCDGRQMLIYLAT